MGYATVGSMCSNWNANTGVNQMGLSEGVLATILAHEIGHNFGIQHDGPNSQNGCPLSGYVMEAVVNVAAALPTQFSSC